MFLVTKWDTTNIRKQVNNPRNIVSPEDVIAYRCYIIENKIEIERIIFKDFFKAYR